MEVLELSYNLFQLEKIRNVFKNEEKMLKYSKLCKNNV